MEPVLNAQSYCSATAGANQEQQHECETGMDERNKENQRATHEGYSMLKCIIWTKYQSPVNMVIIWGLF